MFDALLLRALVGEQTPEDFERAATLLYAVQQQVTCPYSGQILDIRQAVLVEVKHEDIVIYSVGPCMGQIADAIRAGNPAMQLAMVNRTLATDHPGKYDPAKITIDVIDGRVLYPTDPETAE